jgi:hypothetical protein
VVDKTIQRCYNSYMMRKFILAYILLTLLLVLLCSGCSSVNVLVTDSRCVPRQYCAYTDPPPAIRREALRSGSYMGDPAVR